MSILLFYWYPEFSTRLALAQQVIASFQVRLKICLAEKTPPYCTGLKCIPHLSPPQNSFPERATVNLCNDDLYQFHQN